MGRPYALTLCALNIPGILCRGNAEAKPRRLKTHPHFAGLGDGNVNAQQGLRGAGNNRKRKGWKGGDRENNLQVPLSRDEFEHSPRKDFRDRLDDLDDIDVMELMRKGALAHRGSNQTLPPDGPWQLSVLMLLGIMGVLLGLFIHFSTDPNAHPSYFRRRAKKKNSFLSPPSYKKKTDDWSEDEELTEDDCYRGDTEGAVEGTIGKTRSTMLKSPIDPSATLYYQSSNTSGNYRPHDHRVRKVVIQQTPNDTNIWAGDGRNRPESTTFLSPSRQSKPTLSGNSSRIAEKASQSPFRTPPKTDNIGIGSGLEGFVGYSCLPSNIDMISIRSHDVDSVNAHPLVKPMGKFVPTESFESLTIVQNSSLGVVNDLGGVGVDVNTPPMRMEEEMSRSFSPSLQSGSYGSQYSEDLSQLTTPRIDHTRGKRDLSRDLKEKSLEMFGAPLFSASTQQEMLDSQNAGLLQTGAIYEPYSADAIPGIPLVPNLNEVRVKNVWGFDSDAPHSVLLEELLLVRMESGEQEPTWSARSQLVHNAARTEKERRTEEERRTEKERQEGENMEKLREASVDHHDPRNIIQHIRKDLTVSSDASSSLSSKITFSELKLEDVIGGGGFGQVWRAKWKGTPVAVKVLTGSAQAETVPKAVLEEFTAEINMVSGMRHPNICLFMGACLDPPNRAIVTELCENGSLW